MSHAVLRGRRVPARGGRADRGAVAVEFALIVPILMLLVFGIISYGYMLSFRQAMSQAAAEGARAAAVAPKTIDDAARKAAAGEAISGALSGYDVRCVGASLEYRGNPAGTCFISDPEACTSGTGICVIVTLSYTYDDDPLIPPLYTAVVLPNTLEYTTEVRVS